MSTEPGSSYDEIAGMYHRLWDDWYLPAAMPALECLFFSEVRRGAKVLDLCCGSGHVTKELVARGYDVTGVDASAGLIEHAREQLPNVDFRVHDVCELRLEKQFDAILSTFDALNHILTLDGLREAFTAAKNALSPDGLFVFDMNLEEAHSVDLHQWAVTRDEDNVTLVRGNYFPETQLGLTELIWFTRETGAENSWKQHCSIVRERCYPQADILAALREAGFSRVDVLAAVEVGMHPQLGLGRRFYSVRH